MLDHFFFFFEMEVSGESGKKKHTHQCKWCKIKFTKSKFSSTSTLGRNLKKMIQIHRPQAAEGFVD
jgi:hypothetical protein